MINLLILWPIKWRIRRTLTFKLSCKALFWSKCIWIFDSAWSMRVPQTDSPCTEDSWGCGPGSAPDIWGRRCDRREWPPAHRTIWRTKKKAHKFYITLHYITLATDTSILLLCALWNFCLCAVTSCKENTPCLHCPINQHELSSLHTM